MRLKTNLVLIVPCPECGGLSWRDFSYLPELLRTEGEIETFLLRIKEIRCLHCQERQRQHKGKEETI